MSDEHRAGGVQPVAPPPPAPAPQAQGAADSAAAAAFIHVTFVKARGKGDADKDAPPAAKLVKNSLGETDKLSKLRELLGAQVDMSSDDRFLSSEAEISPAQEKDIDIRTALGAEGLKPPHWKVRIQRSTPQVALPTLSPPALTAELLNRSLDMTSRVDERLLKLAGFKTENEQQFDALSVADELRLYDRMNVFRGLSYVGEAVTWSYRNGLRPDVRLRPDHQLKAEDRPLYDGLPRTILAQIPNNTFVQDEVFTFDKTESEIKTVVSWSGGVSARYKVASASVEYGQSDATRKADQKQTLYCYSAVTVPKARLYLPVLTATEDLLTALAWFETRSGRSFADYDALFQLFRTWGTYFARELVIGGKLYATEEKQLSGSVDEKAAKDSFRASVKAELLVAGAAVSGGRDKSSQESNGKANQSRSSLMQSFGGDPGLVAVDASKWVASLGPAIAWRVCTVADLVPVHHFATSQAAHGIYRTLIHWEELWRASKIMMDYDDFIEPLRQAFGRLKIEGEPAEILVDGGTP